MIVALSLEVRGAVVGSVGVDILYGKEVIKQQQCMESTVRRGFIHFETQETLFPLRKQHNDVTLIRCKAPFCVLRPIYAIRLQNLVIPISSSRISVALRNIPKALNCHLGIKMQNIYIFQSI